MSSFFSYNNVFLDPSYSKVTYIDLGASFSVTPPVSNLSKPQLPLFAEFTGDAELRCDAGENFTAQVFALLGHNFDDGMEVEFIDYDASISLGTVEVVKHRGITNHAILFLDAPVTTRRITVKVTEGDALSAYRIGGLWAGPAFVKPFVSSGFSYAPTSLSSVEYADATGYAQERNSYETPYFEFPMLTKAEAVGPAWPNVRAIFREIGYHSPVLCAPDRDNLALSVYGLVTSFTGPIVDVTDDREWRAGMNVREQR